MQRESATPINAQLLNSVLKDQASARTYLLRLISSLRYLCLSGNAIRGWKNDGGNLIELLREREMDVPEIKLWLSKRDNYTSPQIQNEIIEIMGHEVQKVLLRRIKSSPWYSVIVDGTTDASSQEQLAMCARYADQDSLDSHEVFLGIYTIFQFHIHFYCIPSKKNCFHYFPGLYTTDDADAKTITAAIKDVLTRLDLPLDNLRGHCFDGAPVMAGRFNGVQKLLQTEQPKSLYIHCSNHSLDLVLQETAKQTSGVCDSMNLVKDVSNTILDSAKRKKMYDKVVVQPCENDDDDSDDDVPLDKAPSRLLALCPTRWCTRVSSMKRFHQNYGRVQGTLVNIENCETVKADKKAQIRGWSLKLEQTDTLFYLNVSIAIFAPCEQLARALQAPGLTATGAKQAAVLLSSKLEKLRTEAEFNRIFESTLEESNELDLEPLKEPRVRQKNKRYEQTSEPTPPVRLSAKDLLRKNYFEILDLQISELKRRFEQSGFDVLEALETILLNATKGSVSDEAKLTEELGIYAEDFKIGRLHAQLVLLESLTDIASSNISELSEKMSKLPSTTKFMLDQVIRLIILVKTAPAAAATAERSFSALRRIKTYLRSTMSQKRLTHVMLLHVHKEITASLDLNVIMKEFVARSERRKTVFGKIV